MIPLLALLACASAATPVAPVPPPVEASVGVEPAWVQTFVVPFTKGPPDTPCDARSKATAPGTPPSSTPSAPPSTPPPEIDTSSFPVIDLKPGATNANLPEDLRVRALGPVDLASLPVEPLRGNPGDIARIRAVFTRASGSFTRVGFWGASHVAGEYFTGHLRRLWQDRYGDAGHGFVMPVAPWSGYRASDINLCTGGTWSSDFDRRVGGRGDGRLGPGGMSVESGDPNSFGWVETTRENPHGRVVSRFEVMFLRQSGGGTLKMVVDTAPAVEISTAGEGPGVAILQVNPGAHRLTVSPKGDGPVRIVGVNLENEGRGIVVDAMGVNGRTVGSWQRWDIEQMKQWYSRRPYDLVVLAYGTNEANESTLTPDGYRNTLEASLRRMREVFPDQPCLLIGPGDRARKVKDQRYAVWEPNGMVAGIQREVGPRYGCATWDLRAAMGGEGTSLAWWKAGLMSPDLIHYMAAGYQELAGRFSGLVLP